MIAWNKSLFYSHVNGDCLAAYSEVSQYVVEKYFTFNTKCVTSKEFAEEFAETYAMLYCFHAFPHQLPPIIPGKLGSSKINYMAPIISGKISKQHFKKRERVYLKVYV